MPSTLNPKLNFNQTLIRAAGSHSNAGSQQPAQSGPVTQIVAGANVTVTPPGGTGVVTVAAAAGTGTVTHTAGNLTANAVVLGNAMADIKVLGSLGTTTTVLHGNAAGAPSFAQVALADQANINAYTVLANNTGSAAAPIAITEEQFRTMFFQQQFYVDDYVTAAGGAVLTGLNAAIAALNTATVGSLVFGPGTYAVNGAVTAITAACEIKGCGLGVTTITQAATGSGAFVLNTTSPCFVHDLTLTGPGSGSSTVGGIVVGSVTVANSGSVLTRMQVNGWLCGVVAAGTGGGTEIIISDSTIGGNVNGIVVGGVVTAGVVGASADSGAMIKNCTCNNTSKAIWILWGDGVYIEGNALVGSPTAIQFDFEDVAAKSDLWILGNHIENATTAGIVLNIANLVAGGVHSFGNIVIVGNEMAEQPLGITVTNTGAGGPYLDNVCVTGNVITLNGANTSCVKLYQVFHAVIDGNAMSFNGGANFHIFIDTTCTQVVVGSNAYVGGGAWTVAALASNLPPASCTASRHFVTDAVKTIALGIGTVPIGGGANFVPVFCDGANWYIA